MATFNIILDKRTTKGKEKHQLALRVSHQKTVVNLWLGIKMNTREYDSVFNKKSFDSDFTHDAPCPMEVYDIFTETFTLPGDTCIDIHCGAGQGLEVFARHGCNGIGVDIDPESVEFCRKRMDIVLSKNEIIEYQQAA
jgi:2-polyprenyl-3-methyl-5-hydroxy-6-metoxy-1,4-benzoquinol methylase